MVAQKVKWLKSSSRPLNNVVAFANILMQFMEIGFSDWGISFPVPTLQYLTQGEKWGLPTK